MKKTKRLHIRTTEEQYNQILELSKSYQYKHLSKYVIDTALKQNKDFALIKHKSKILTELRKIGTNINQIAFSLNTIAKTEDYKIYDLSTLSNHLENLKKQLEEIREASK